VAPGDFRGGRRAAAGDPAGGRLIGRGGTPPVPARRDGANPVGTVAAAYSQGLWQTPAVGDEEGGLSARELVPAAGGEWQGLLFDHQAVGVPPALTWTFRVVFEPVRGEPVTLDVEWLPVPAAGWRLMAGQAVASGSFAEPAEASVHHVGYHRYDRVELRVAEQDGARVRVVVTVSGDLDGLGPQAITADAWLTFTGISVQLGDTPSAEAALARLAAFTDTAGLVERPDPRGIAFRFGPEG
jgi:hypothetical protein